MKLANHTEHIRQLIETAFRNRLGRMGINKSNLIPIESIPQKYVEERQHIKGILKSMTAETGGVAEGYEKLVEELTFTLFNRIAALKVMEAHTLHPEIITRRKSHGGRSFAHSLWVEQHPHARMEDDEGLLQFFKDQLNRLSDEIPLFSAEHPYHLLPTAIELNSIIDAFNRVENDPDVQDDIWKSDDVLGWLYESYNNYKKAAHKAGGKKTEYNKVSMQSQVYTPRWVVKFLVDNSLGKLYLEMFPDSEIKENYAIANAPKERTREIKPLHEIRIIDPATGSGNFLLYAFDMLYDMYIDQIENYGADYDEVDIPKLIIENNLYGIDLDDRAVQLAQLGLYIKAKRKKHSAKIGRFNIVSSDFYLPEYEQVMDIFEANGIGEREKNIIKELWSDLQNAYKFGSLVHLEEKMNRKWFGEEKKIADVQPSFPELDNEYRKNFESFKNNFFNNLQKAVAHNKVKQGLNFLNTKTADAITFLQLITQKYDVAVANPPYTDSSDYGPELKKFIEDNYKKPYKFNTNLYAVFIKRCFELADVDGKLALVHPLTFMYIKTFEDVRKFIIDKTHISIFVEWGYLGMFNPLARVDSAMYVLENSANDEDTLFIKLNDIYEGKRYAAFIQAYSNVIENGPNPRVYYLPQEKLKIIDGWPFIYWISDVFREKFRGKVINDYFYVVKGLTTGDNNMFIRFWWEVDKFLISEKKEDNRKWVKYAKGGHYNKWFGNNWCVVNWGNNGYEIKNYFDTNGRLRSCPRNENFYFKEGITYTAAGAKGASYRELPPNHITDAGGSGIFSKKYSNIDYTIGFLNSKIVEYISDCLNPTVNINQGDIWRIPFIIPSTNIEFNVSILAKENIFIKKHICTYNIIEINFEQNPLTAFPGNSFEDRVLAYLNYENYQLTKVLINEAIIDELIFHVYDISPEDRAQVEVKMGKSIGSLPVLPQALEAFKQKISEENAETKEFALEHLNLLQTTEFDEQTVREIKEDFAKLYQSNNDLTEFCKRHRVNPVNMWYWFKEANILPPARAKDIALEFLADTIRTLLKIDEDGIIPLVGLPGEDALSQRLEQYCIENGFTQAQFMWLDNLLGRPLNDYMEHHFFKDLSDHLNLFMYLPKTPFIWHLSSGPHQGLEVYTLIYKWNRDSLFKLKSHYIQDRINSLQYRQMQLQDATNTAQVQSEKEKIRFQLQEIEEFAKKIDELVAEDYDPKLDDGVGKNIAPLQKKGMLQAEVLKLKDKNSQLEKYLNADW